jgi:hypothetical protein
MARSVGQLPCDEGDGLRVGAATGGEGSLRADTRGRNPLPGEVLYHGIGSRLCKAPISFRIAFGSGLAHHPQIEMRERLEPPGEVLEGAFTIQAQGGRGAAELDRRAAQFANRVQAVPLFGGERLGRGRGHPALGRIGTEIGDERQCLPGVEPVGTQLGEDAIIEEGGMPAVERVDGEGAGLNEDLEDIGNDILEGGQSGGLDTLGEAEMGVVFEEVLPVNALDQAPGLGDVEASGPDRRASASTRFTMPSGSRA